MPSAHQSHAVQQTNPVKGSSVFSRAGYTLIEMLIVLGILVAITSLVTPALRGPLNKSRLRAAARNVSAALSKARVLAVKQGNDVEFRYLYGGSQWEIRRAASSQLAGLSSPDSESQLSDSLLEDSDEVSESSGNEILKRGQLPVGTTFHQPSPLNVDNDFGSSKSSQSLQDESEPFAAEQWSAPVKFRANGRCEDQQLILHGDRGFTVLIELRGLTGAVQYAAPVRDLNTHNREADGHESTGASL